MKIKEEWIPIQEACLIMDRHYESVRAYCRKGMIECRRFMNRGSSPIMVNKLSIPTFMRRKKEEAK